VWRLNKRTSKDETNQTKIQKDIDNILENLKPHQLETIKIKPLPERPKNIWSSKFGGKPYWPTGKSYPETNEGEPLFLLAQLNFDELPHIEGYPKKGMLQFFIANDGMYGLNFDKPINEVMTAPDGYRVIYHSEISKDNVSLQLNTPETNKDNQLPISGEYALEFYLTKEQPSPTDYRFDAIIDDVFSLDDAVASYLFDNLDASGSKLGGYANFTQDDPRSMKHTGTWILLFQMDTEFSDGVDIMWGDTGVGNFFIEPQSLNDCDFSKVWYNWDCC